ncbi:helix-turn-helix domain-containing protein [Streptomyces sp. NPDC020472]|uniref:helix-turn-helix domain-containing protein n=1 Tax=Streptomyces sp. NPDC020472 TaxID=3365075 RepID=UPI0037974037
MRDSKALPALIRRRYREGASIAVVARELGVSKTTVQRHLPAQERRDAAAAARQRHQNRAEQPYEKALRAQVVRLYRSGMPQQRVAATLGISVQAVTARFDPSQRRSRKEAARLAVQQQGDLLPQDEIITRYVQGATITELGQLYAVHPSTIRRRIPDDLIRPPRPDPAASDPTAADACGRGDPLALPCGGELLRARPRVRRVSPHHPGTDPRRRLARPPDQENSAPATPPPPKPRTISSRMTLPAPDEEILARYRAGQSASAIAREAGVDCRTILRRIPEDERRTHLQARQLNRPAPGTGAESIRALRAQGLAWAAIAAETGLSVKTVRARA